MKAMSFLVDSELYVVDATLMHKVVRSISITSVPTSNNAVVGIINLKGKVITILSIPELFGVSKNSEITPELYSNVAIFKPVRGDNDQMGVLIDTPGSLIDIDEDLMLPPPIDKEQQNSAFISGVVNADNKLYRILDITAIFESFTVSGAKHTVEANKED